MMRDKLYPNMINAEAIAAAYLLLHDADFPSNYVHMAHPDDQSNNRLQPIYHTFLGTTTA
jgi:hypothetical protein